MHTRKLTAATASAVLAVTLTLSAAPAYAQSLNGWVHQTNSHFHSLAQRVYEAGSSKAMHTERGTAVFFKDVDALASYGLAHPPPGADRADFLTAMHDLRNAASDWRNGNNNQSQQDVTDGQNAMTNLPQALPRAASWWTSGQFA